MKIYFILGILLISLIAYAAPTKKFFEPVEIQNLKFEGNTFTSTNSNGDININANGTGDLRIEDQVGVNGAPHASAIFQVSSTTQGAVCAPKMNTTQRDAISSPTSGLVVYNTTENKLNVYDGTAWIEVGEGGGGGGSALVGYRVEGQASPNDILVNTVEYLRFGFNPSINEYYYYRVKIPDNFKTGKRIKLAGGKFKVNSNDTSKDVLINATVYLLKTGDTLTSFANLPYNSTNTEVAPTSTPDSAIAIGDIFLSDSNGQIDSRNPAPGDDLVIRIRRDMSSETASLLGYVDVIKDSFNISFNN